MAVRPWRREFYRRLHCQAVRPVRQAEGFQVPPLLVTLGVGLLTAFLLISLAERKLQPVLTAAAQAQTRNKMTAVLEQAVMDDLAGREVGYGDLVTIQRDESGTITALTTDMAKLNLLRGELISAALEAVDGVDISELEIPLGSLFDSEILWARGPSIQVRTLSVGTVSAEFDSRFSSAGVNQTQHRVWLDLSVPITLLLPVGAVEVPVDTRLCIAETVIVGQVPDTYLQVGEAKTE